MRESRNVIQSVLTEGFSAQGAVRLQVFRIPKSSIRQLCTFQFTIILSPLTTRSRQRLLHHADKEY
jgi:hypothetical protein